MAEIGMLQDVWASIKVQLCWWHLWKAVQEWLSKNKLFTTPYNAKCAHLEYVFIDTTFIPLGHVDPHEYEGGMCDIIANVKDEPPHPSPNMISILIKPPLKPHNLWPWTTISSTGGGKVLRLTVRSNVKPKCGNNSSESLHVFLYPIGYSLVLFWVLAKFRYSLRTRWRSKYLP